MYVDVTLDDIILYALEHHVSDIHFDPVKSGVHVRLRQDGLLQNYMTVSNEDAELIINRIKVCSSLDISEKRLPQDGRWAWSHKDLCMSHWITLFWSAIISAVCFTSSNSPFRTNRMGCSGNMARYR